MKAKLNRRKFFGLTAIAAISTAIFSNSPLKFIDRENRFKIHKKVKLHSSAVKRTKKVL